MNKQTSEKEQDIKNVQQEAVADEPTVESAATDNMAEAEAAESDNMAEPSLEEQLAAWRDKYLRLQAEFDNFRKRTIKEKMELVERGCEGAWKSMLPILDDIERAVAAHPRRHRACRGCLA